MATDGKQNAQADNLEQGTPDEQSEPPSLQSLTLASSQSSNDSQVEAITKEQVYFSHMYDGDCSVVQELALRLDKKDMTMKDVTSLADILEAPEIIKSKCRSNYNHSPSSDLINLPEVSMRTMKDFVAKLGNIERKDVIAIINAAEIPETAQVEILLLKYHKVFERLTSMLDQPGTLNWKRLGREYKIDSTQLDILEKGINSAERFLIEYAYKAVPREDLKLSTLVTHMSALGREKEIEDLLKNIKANDRSQSMKKVFAPNSDNMEKLCKLLNKGTKGWQHLAEKWKLDCARYYWFIADTNASATEILLEWLMIKKPEFTVAQLDKSLQDIGRQDARDILDEKFKECIAKLLL